MKSCTEQLCWDWNYIKPTKFSFKIGNHYGYTRLPSLKSCVLYITQSIEPQSKFCVIKVDSRDRIEKIYTVTEAIRILKLENI